MVLAAVRVSGTLNWNLFAGVGVAQAGTPAANTGYMLRAFFSGSPEPPPAATFACNCWISASASSIASRLAEYC